MATRVRFRIWNSSTSAVEHTIDEDHLRLPPAVGGQRVDVLRARTEARPWQVEVLDDADFFSAKLADTDGRMQLLGRLVDVQRSTDNGTTYTTLATGRLADTVDQLTHYVVTVHDERFVERRTTVFQEQDTPPGTGSSSDYFGTILYPAGLPENYGPFGPRRLPSGQVTRGVGARAGNTTGNLIAILLDDWPGGQPGWNAQLRELANADLRADPILTNTASSGNFRTLLLNLDGTDREIVGFSMVTGLSGQQFIAEVGPVNQTRMWILKGALTSGSTFGEAYLHMPTAEPSKLLPFHINTLPPFQIVKDLYDEAGVRYSSSGMDALIDDSDFPQFRFRLTGPENLASWLEDHIYGPLGVAPFVNSSGEVEPKKLKPPTTVNSTGLFQFTAARTAEQPAWQFLGREQVTAVKFRFTHEQLAHTLADDGDWAGDLLDAVEGEISHTHDRLDSTQAPRIEVTFLLDGMHGAPPLAERGDAPFRVQSQAEKRAQQLFQLFGDGPIRGTVSGLSTAQDVDVGDFATIKLGTFYNPKVQARSSSHERLVLITDKSWAVGGWPEFEWLDAGAGAQPDPTPLPTPSVTLAPATSVDDKHFVRADISGGTSATDFRYTLQWAQQLSAAPASSEWEGPAKVSTAGSTVQLLVGPLPSNSTIWTRARVEAPGQIGSEWSTAVNTTTAKITAPSNFSGTTGSTRGQTTLNWDLGDTLYGIELRHSSGACGTPAAALKRFAARDAAPAATSVTLKGLSEGTTHCFGVRHFDPWGGFSTEPTVQLEFSTDLPDAEAVLRATLVMGTTCT